MVWLYGITVTIGASLVVVWMVAHALADGRAWDPEVRFGAGARRVVVGLTGFGLGGLSAEFSPFDLTWPLALVLAVIAAIAMVIVADRISASEGDPG